MKKKQRDHLYTTYLIYNNTMSYDLYLFKKNNQSIQEEFMRHMDNEEAEEKENLNEVTEEDYGEQKEKILHALKTINNNIEVNEIEEDDSINLNISIMDIGTIIDVNKNLITMNFAYWSDNAEEEKYKKLYAFVDAIVSATDYIVYDPQTDDELQREDIKKAVAMHGGVVEAALGKDQ